MRTSIVILLITAAAAVLLGAAAYIRYRRRLDAALSDSADASAREHRSASPAEFVPWLLIALLVIWNGVTLGKVSSVGQQLDNLSMNMQSQMQVMNARIAHLEEMLKSETDILRDCEWSFGDLDPQTNRAALDFTLYPASYTETSKLSLSYGGETVSFTQQSAGVFKGTASIDIFRVVEDPAVLTMTDGSASRTQVLDDLPTGYLFVHFLPVWMAEASTLKAARKGDALTLTGDLVLAPYGKESNVQVTKAELIKEVNGTVTGRVPVTLDGGMATLTLDETFAGFGADGTLRLLLETATSAGHTVRTLLISIDPSDGGAPVLHCDDTEVFDPSGRSLLHWGE